MDNTQDVSNEVVLTEKELQEAIRDPRYWRDLDPAFVNKVRRSLAVHYEMVPLSVIPFERNTDRELIMSDLFKVGDVVRVDGEGLSRFVITNIVSDGVILYSLDDGEWHGWSSNNDTYLLDSDYKKHIADRRAKLTYMLGQFDMLEKSITKSLKNGNE